MAELPVELPNLLKFPMGKLCFDLVLEVIDELEPKDVPELMKVDRRFRWILLQKPARIFGKQIHSIDVKQGEYCDDDEEENENSDCFYIAEIRKFPGSTLHYFNLDSDVLLLAQLERCLVLNILQVGDQDIDEKELLALKKIFVNLKQVDELNVTIYDGNNFSDLLVNLKAEVTDRASLKVCRWNEEVEQELLLSLIGGRLQHCRTISIDVTDLYPTVYSALSKTQLELFVTEIFSENVVSTIELILNSGLPSENKEAACFLHWLERVEINNWFKNLPKIRHVNERNKTFIRDTMMETLRKHRIMFYYSLDNPIHCYWKRIDENRDCIYAVNDNFFFAKYVSSIQ